MDSGAVYAFRHDGTSWLEVRKYVDDVPGPSGGDHFGKAVAVEGARIVVGSDDDTNGTNAGAVFSGQSPDLGFHAFPSAPPIGTSFSLTSCGGTPGQLTAVFVTEVNGVPFSQVLFVGAFGAGGCWSLSGTVPNDPGLIGLSADLLALGLAGGDVVVSNTENVSVQ